MFLKLNLNEIYTIKWLKRAGKSRCLHVGRVWWVCSEFSWHWRRWNGVGPPREGLEARRMHLHERCWGRVGWLECTLPRSLRDESCSTWCPELWVKLMWERAVWGCWLEHWARASSNHPGPTSWQGNCGGKGWWWATQQNRQMTDLSPWKWNKF